MNPQITPTQGGNCEGHLNDLFLMTDEQILQIDPEPQDVEVGGVAPAALAVNSAEPAQTSRPESATSPEQSTRSTDPNHAQTQNAPASIATPSEPPAWLADTMNDPQHGAEARAIWEGAQKAERDRKSV